MRTLSDTFDGVLATGVSADPGTPPADLSYLTLAPLVTQELTRDADTSEAEPTTSEQSIPNDSDDESESSGPERDELRVQELLHEEGDRSAGEQDLWPNDLTVSDAPQRTLEDKAGGEDRSEQLSERTSRSDGQSSLIGQGGQDGHWTEDGSVDVSDRNREWPVSDPPPTDVEQAAHGMDLSEAQRQPSGPDDREASIPPEDFRPVRGSESQAERGPSDAVPTTVVQHGASSNDESGAGPEGQTGPVSDPEVGVRTPRNGRGGPALTVTGLRKTEVSTESDTGSDSEPDDTQRQSRTTDSPGEETEDEAVAERTVIRSDGRLNDRVFDRLYEEVSRKMRLERNREGR